MFDRITFNPNVMGGRACILQREDIQQAIEYAAWLAQQQVQTSYQPMRFLADIGLTCRE